MKKTVFIFLAVISFIARSQTITVIDRTTREALPGTAVYSAREGSSAAKSVITNTKGQADISGFSKTDSLFFRHMSYNLRSLSFSRLETMNFKVELEETNISLNEIVVSASRWEEKQLEVPYRVEKIDMKDVALLNPQTAADLLGTSGYAYIQKSQMAGGSPMLRGFATNRVMLVVDGVRMNNAIFRSGNLQNVISIDAYSLESTEILFGPGAVLYGSDAIGGVMDFHTLQPRLSDSSDNTFIKANAFTRYSTANTEKTGHLDFNVGRGKWAFLTGVTYSDFGDLKTGSKGSSHFLRPVYQQTVNGKDTQVVNSDQQLQKHSGYRQFNLLQRILFRPVRSVEIDYGFYYSGTSDAPRYDRLYTDGNDDGVLDNAEWYYGPQKWTMNRLGITHTGNGKAYNQLRLTVARQDYQESRHDRKFNNKKLRNQTERVGILSLNLDLDKKIGEKATLFYGAEGIYNKIGSEADRTHIVSGEKEPFSTRYPDGSTWKAYGIYGNLKYKLDRKWIMNAGIRYSHFIIKAVFDTSLFPLPFKIAENNNGAVNGGIGFVFSPDPTWQIYANVSTGFRAPNIDDIGKVFESEPGSVIVPNDRLRAEYAYNAETGMAKTFGKFLKADFALYYTLLDNALARRNFQYNGRDSILYDGELSQVQAVQNIARAYVYGIQGGINIYFGKGVGLESTICYQYGREQSEDSLIYYPKPHVAPMFGSTHLTYAPRKMKFDLYVLYNSKMDYKDLPLSERNDDAPYAKDENGFPFVPGWYTLNFKAGFYLSRYVSVNAGIENITDQLYRPYASGISAPGRNLVLSLRGSF